MELVTVSMEKLRPDKKTTEYTHQCLVYAPYFLQVSSREFYT